VNAFLSRLTEGAFSFALFAQDAPADGGANENSSMLISMLPLVAIFVLFYFMMVRPQRKEQARRMDMLASVKKNDWIVTAGGIYGVVTNVRRESDEATIKVDEATNTKLRITLSSIVRVLGDKPAEDGANPS
jgi:preprotein translocase subunit YajC